MAEITGKIIKVMDPVKGEGKNGPWKKQEFIFETPGEYPKKVCIANWNDKVSPDDLKVGEEITVSINIESREFNDRWYTDVKMWRIEKQAPTGQADAPPPPDIADAPPQLEEDDGLPF